DDEAARVVAAWRKRADWKLEPRGFDQAEESSYLSEQFLRNFMAGFDLAARLETVGPNAADRLKLVTEFLDNRQALEPICRLKLGPGDVADKCLELLDGTRLEFGPTSPKVGAELAKFPGVAGAWKKGGVLTLYVAGERLHALE